MDQACLRKPAKPCNASLCLASVWGSTCCGRVLTAVHIPNMELFGAILAHIADNFRVSSVSMFGREISCFAGRKRKACLDLGQRAGKIVILLFKGSSRWKPFHVKRTQGWSPKNSQRLHSYVHFPYSKLTLSHPGKTNLSSIHNFFLYHNLICELCCSSRLGVLFCTRVCVCMLFSFIFYKCKSLFYAGMNLLIIKGAQRCRGSVF